MSDQFSYPDNSSPDMAGGSGESLGELLGRYWALIKRFYWVLILTSLAGLGVAYVWTDQQPRIFQASSKIIFHENQPNVLGSEFEQVEFVDPGGRWQFEEFWNTQKEVLNSSWFVRRVVEQEGLVDDPRLFGEPAEGESMPSEDERRRRAVSAVRGATEYSLQRNSRVANIEVRFEDPELAAQVANGVAESYVDYIQGMQSGGMEQLSEWFDDYVTSQRAELDAAHGELQEYQQDHNILSLSYEDRSQMTRQALDSVSNRLRDVEAELYGEEALLNQIREMEDQQDDLRALADLVDNQALSGLLDRERELEQQRAQVRSRYLEDHPRMQEIDGQLEVVREGIDEEIARIRSSVENRAAVTRRNMESLASERDRLTAEVAELNDIGLDYNQLRDSTETLRQHYEAVLSRTTELDLNALYEHEIIQVLEEAEAPGGPVSPQVPLNLAVGLLLGLALGAGTMVFIDALDNTVKRQEHVTRYTKRPILGSLPTVNKSALKGVASFGDSALDTLTHTAPRSSFAEGIKTLRTNLVFMSSEEKPPKVVLMTSPGPGEGKTLTSMNMAIAFAQSGEKTVLVDSDMRRPRIRKALGMDKGVGLSDLITDKATIEEVVRPSGIDEGLDVITCGTVPPNPSELLHRERFKQVVEELRERYDRVIFDSPPLAAVTDALILSHSVDAVMLILRFGQTRQELLGRSLEQLEAIGAPLVGTVLNDVDQSSGYGYAYYYRYDNPQAEKGADGDKNGRSDDVFSP